MKTTFYFFFGITVMTFFATFCGSIHNIMPPLLQGISTKTTQRKTISKSFHPPLFSTFQSFMNITLLVMYFSIAKAFGVVCARGNCR